MLEIAHNSLLSEDLTGGLIKVAPDGTQTILAADGLVAPGWLSIPLDGQPAFFNSWVSSPESCSNRLA